MAFGYRYFDYLLLFGVTGLFVKVLCERVIFLLAMQDVQKMMNDTEAGDWSISNRNNNYLVL